MTASARPTSARATCALFGLGIVAGFLLNDASPWVALGTLGAFGLAAGFAGWAWGPAGPVAATTALVPLTGLQLHEWFC